MSLLKEIKAFSKAQVSAFAGGVIDFIIMLICVEVFKCHYVTGIVIGGIIGAIFNYSVNRYWSFKGTPDAMNHQIGKFIIVVIGSILLKSLGTSLFTEVLLLDYKLSRLITDAIVSLGFNYMLQRYWVFKNQLRS